MLIINILLLFIHVYSASSPLLYRGGCDVLDDKLFYIGGVTEDKNSTDFKYNYNVYSLDLKSGFTLEEGDAQWEKISDNGPKLEYGSVIRNKESSSLIIFGGNKILKEQSLKRYLIKDNKIEYNNDTMKSFPFVSKSPSGKPLNYSFERSSFSIDDKDPNLYYHFGGYTSTPEDFSVKWSKLTLYNSTSNSFKEIGESQTPVYNHMANVYQNKLYIIGGVFFEDKGIRNMSSIMIYDFESKRFTIERAKGEIPEPRIAGSSLLLEDKIVIVGGTKDVNATMHPKSSIYTLDLKNLVYEEHEVPDFTNTFMGCLATYNNHLIYSFGSKNNIITSKTQVVDMNNWKLVQSLPPFNDNNISKSIDDSKPSASSNPNPTTSELNLQLIIGGSIGGVIALLLLILIIYLVKRNKREKKQEELPINKDEDMYELKPPEMLKENLWISPKLSELEDIPMSLTVDTILPDFDYSDTDVNNGKKIIHTNTLDSSNFSSNTRS